MLKIFQRMSSIEAGLGNLNIRGGGGGGRGGGRFGKEETTDKHKA